MFKSVACIAMIAIWSLARAGTAPARDRMPDLIKTPEDKLLLGRFPRAA
jgi:hypothetical protein